MYELWTHDTFVKKLKIIHIIFGSMDYFSYLCRNQLKIDTMAKRKIILTATRTYVKTISFEVEVDENIKDESLIDYLTEDKEINEMFEEKIYQASLNLDDTNYGFQDPTNDFGGTL